jgi:ATP-dependent RNA helicase DHX8/PRP22
MLLDDIKPTIPNEKDKQVVDDLMDELENLGAKVKSKHDDDEDEHKKKKKHHRHRSPDSKHDRKKSRYFYILTKHSYFLNLPSIISHKDRKRRRHSSTGSHSSNGSDSSGGSDRSPSPKHHHSSKKSKHHDRNDSPPRRKGTSSIPDKPMVGSIYDGTVISIMQWGCFVRLDQFRNRTEGLVHISNVNIYIFI